MTAGQRYCPSCGTLGDADLRFCPSCGKPLPPADPSAPYAPPPPAPVAPPFAQRDRPASSSLLRSCSAIAVLLLVLLGVGGYLIYGYIVRSSLRADVENATREARQLAQSNEPAGWTRATALLVDTDHRCRDRLSDEDLADLRALLGELTQRLTAGETVRSLQPRLQSAKGIAERAFEEADKATSSPPSSPEPKTTTTSTSAKDPAKEDELKALPERPRSDGLAQNTAPTPDPPAHTERPTGISVRASGPTWHQAGPVYPVDSGEITLRLKVDKPGSILDTVGLNAAAPGSFSLNVQADGRIIWNVYSPALRSSVRDAGGWHRLISGPVDLSSWHEIRIRYGRDGASLTVDGREVSVPELKASLSGQPVFIGDFPNDAQWEPKHNSKLGFTGQVNGLVFTNR